MNKLAAWAGKVSGSRYPTSGRGKRSGGTTFSSKEALATYARAHPAADMSKHSVAASAPKAAAPAAANRPAAPALLPPPGPRPQTLREVNQQAKAHAETAYQSSKAANKTNTPEAHAAAAAAHDVAALHAGSSAAVRMHRSAQAEHKAAAAPAAAPAAQPLTTQAAALRGAPAPQATAGAKAMSERANATNTVGAHRAAAVAHGAARESHALAGNTAEAAHHASQQALHTDKYRAPRTPRGARPERAAPTAAPAAAPTAPLPAAGSYEHSRREEVAKSAAQGGEREASRGADAMRAGKAGLAANHYMKAATNHLALHPTHGSLESQITKAESALSSAAAALDRVTDRASANRLDASMREAKGVVANMKKFAAMKPEQREAEVIKRNQNSRMR
jgi:hypothetical protein